MLITIQTASDAIRPQWDALHGQCSDSTLFSSFTWLEHVAGAWLAVMVEVDGQVIAGMALPFKKLPLIGTLAREPEFLRFTGLMVANNYAGQKQKIAEQVIAEIGKRGLKAFDISFPFTQGREELLPWIQAGYHAILRYTYLLGNSEAYEKGIDKTVRKRIEKAQSKGWSVNRDFKAAMAGIEELDKDYEKNGKKFLTERGLGKIRGILSDNKLTSNILTYTLLDNSGIVKAVAVRVHDAWYSYALLAISRRDADRSEAAALVMHLSIEEALAAGRQFVFYGSVMKGVEAFIRSFGGTALPYYRMVKYAPALGSKLK